MLGNSDNFQRMIISMLSIYSQNLIETVVYNIFYKKVTSLEYLRYCIYRLLWQPWGAFFSTFYWKRITAIFEHLHFRNLHFWLLTHYERSGAKRRGGQRSGEMFTCKRSGAARLISRYEGFCAFLLLGGVKNRENTGFIPLTQRKKTIVNSSFVRKAQTK